MKRKPGMINGIWQLIIFFNGGLTFKIFKA